MAGEMQSQRGLRVSFIGQDDVDKMSTDVETPLERLKQSTTLKDHEVEEKLAEFGLLHETRLQMESLSGGQRMRVLLAEVAAQESHFLVLDEPTNHLDIFTIDSVISSLKAFDGGVIFATHNRYFLDQIADDILDISHSKIELERTELEPDVVHISGYRRRRWMDG